MTLEKAIELIKYMLMTWDFILTQDERDALKLSLEALERVQINRQPIRAHWREPLPGETLE